MCRSFSFSFETGENVSENRFAWNRKKFKRNRRTLVCAAQLRFRSKWRKCERKSFRLEPKKIVKQNQRTLGRTCYLLLILYLAPMFCVIYLFLLLILFVKTRRTLLTQHEVLTSINVYITSQRFYNFILYNVL